MLKLMIFTHLLHEAMASAEWIGVLPAPIPTITATIKTDQWRMTTETTETLANLSVIEHSTLTLLCEASYPVRWLDNARKEVPQSSTDNPASTNRYEVLAAKQYQSRMMFENFNSKFTGTYVCSIDPYPAPQYSKADTEKYLAIIVHLHVHPVPKPANFVQILQTGFNGVKPRPSSYYRYWESRFEIPVVHTSEAGTIVEYTLKKPPVAGPCFNSTTSQFLTGGMSIEQKTLSPGVGQLAVVVNHGSYICAGDYSFIFQQRTKNETRPLGNYSFYITSDTISNEVIAAETITSTQSYIMLNRQWFYELRAYLTSTTSEITSARLRMDYREHDKTGCHSAPVLAKTMPDDCGLYGFSLFDDGGARGISVIMIATRSCTLTVFLDQLNASMDIGNNRSHEFSSNFSLITTVFDGAIFGSRFESPSVFPQQDKDTFFVNDTVVLNCLVPKCHMIWITWADLHGFIWPPFGNDIFGVQHRTSHLGVVNVTFYDDWTMNYELHLPPLQLNKSSEYGCHYSSSSSRKQSRLATAAARFDLKVEERKLPNFSNATVEDQPESGLVNGKAELKCVKGRQAPDQIIWIWETSEPKEKFLQPVLNSADNRTILVFSPGRYICKIVSGFDVTVKNFGVRETPASYNSIGITALGISIPSLLILIAILFCIHRCIERKNVDASFKRLSYILNTSIHKKVFIDGLAPLNDQVQQIPYNQSLEVDRGSFTVTQRLLGTGEFGCIYKGDLKLKDNDEIISIAVKIPRDSMNIQAYRALTDELKIMNHIRPHINVLRLIGACTQNLEKREMYVLTEFCENGSLRDYLIKNTMKFEGFKVNAIGQFVGSPGAVEALLNYAYQAANGMSHLANQKVIHRDLALRNLLLTVGHIVKVADFGMSRHNRSIYRKRLAPDVPVPIFWMSLESLMNDEYTYKSDVWSFGVMLWEMFSCGKRPYADHEQDFSFRSWLAASENNRMGPSTIACEEMYDLMRNCWKQIPDARPSFGECKRIISRLLEQRSPDMYQSVMLSLSEAWLNIPPTEGKLSSNPTSTAGATSNSSTAAEASQQQVGEIPAASRISEHSEMLRANDYAPKLARTGLVYRIPSIISADNDAENEKPYSTGLASPSLEKV